MSSDSGTKRRTPSYLEVDGFRLPGFFTEKAYRSALQYKPRPDDFFINTFPKCGTTWMQNIVISLFRHGEPLTTLMDYFTQTPFLELTGAEGAETMRRPGPIKLHLPFNLTPYSPEAKYLIVARNPKDCCVSFYYHTKGMPGYQFHDGTFDDYFEIFMNGENDFGDYFDNLLSWYEHRNDKNVLFLTYEEVKKDTATYIKRIAEFMGPEYKAMLESDPKLLPEILNNVSFKSMRDGLGKDFVKLHEGSLPDHPSMPEGLRDVFKKKDNFHRDDKPVLFRKGIVGDWRNHFSQEQNARLEAKFRERTQGTDIPNWWKDCM